MDHQPGSSVCAKKSARDRLIALAERHPEYALGFQDEVWWSRVTQPHMHAWADADSAWRLVEQIAPKDDPDRKALACYGLLVSCPGAPETLPEQVWLRFVEDRPVSAVTTQYLAWCCDKLANLGKQALLMIWDNASWHLSKEVRTWICDHNRAIRQQGQGVRIVACYLPSKSPWLNRIEPHWMHGKRKIVEPARLLTAQELADRVCAHFGCEHESHLAVTEKAA
jgi:transposase